MTLIVGEVGRIILSFASPDDTSDFGCDLCWALVGTHEKRHTIRSRVATGSSNGFSLNMSQLNVDGEDGGEITVALRGWVILLPPALAIMFIEDDV